MSEIDSLKVHQEEYKKKLQDVDEMKYEEHPYHDYFREIPFHRLKKMVDLNHKRVHVASCGTGVDVHYLKKHFPNIQMYISDISEDAVNLVKKSFDVEGSAEDTENLPFKDGEFDYCYVANALHHLKRPNKGLYELIRVAKEGVVVSEPNNSWLTRLTIRLGLVKEYEDPWLNYVYRYDKYDVQQIAKSIFYECEVDQYFAIHAHPKSKLKFLFLKALNSIANIIYPSIGNTITFTITKASSKT